MLISVRKDRSSYRSFSCINQGSQTAQTPGGKGVRIQAEDFGHSGTIHLRISGSTCFKLLDVGLSKLCPKANRQLMFARGLQVKTETFCTQKSYAVRLLKRLNSFMSIASQPRILQSNLSKSRTVCPNRSKQIHFKTTVNFGTNSRFLNAIGLFPAKSGINH